MTDQQHPIIPPPELVAKLWREASAGRDDAPIGEIFNHGVLLAYAAGADQELEACELYLAQSPYPSWAKDLREYRRPNPPSLKEQALHILDTHVDLTYAEADTIRRALEALDD